MEQFGIDHQIISVQNFLLVPIKHKLSHQSLSIQFWKVKTKGLLEQGLSVLEVEKFPFPIVIINFIKKDLLK